MTSVHALLIHLTTQICVHISGRDGGTITRPDRVLYGEYGLCSSGVGGGGGSGGVTAASGPVFSARRSEKWTLFSAGWMSCRCRLLRLSIEPLGVSMM